MAARRARRKIDVAIVGGGCAGLTTAFELTRPIHRGRYRVTVYQLGWRLGGKGASGRGPSGRIQEHGLHLWMGFYENAFRILRECYGELGRDPRSCPIAVWRDAFSPDPYVGVAEQRADGSWTNWAAWFPPGAGDPGDPLTERNPFSVAGYLTRCVGLLRTLLASLGESAGVPVDEPGSRTPPPGASMEELTRDLLRLVGYGQLAGITALLQALGLLESALGVLARNDNLLLAALRTIERSARAQLESLVDANDETRRLWEIIDIVLAALRGALRFGLLTHPRGFEAIDDYDWREWLRENGASEAALDSAFLRGTYDLLLAYEDGDPARPRLAAGQALRGAVRMFFSYRGALFWKMRAGMGDVVFAPLYEVLRRRGVRFEFFHRLENVRLADATTLAPGERPHVEALEFDVQSRVRGGGEYEPLIDVRGLPCWPAEPLWGQLVGGARHRRAGHDFESHWDRHRVARKTLEVGTDFDLVVLAVGMGAVPHVAGELVERDPRWRRMVENVKTVPTQAFQVWLNEDMETLGWHRPQINLSAFVKPFDTWADMRQVLPFEDWREPPRAVAYFCNVLADEPPAAREDADYPRRRHAEVRANAVGFLDRHVGHLWPGAVTAEGTFRWDLLVDPDGGRRVRGEARFDTQYWTASVNPSDRYVLALPGSLRHRISPLDNSYDNLTIAGDWTDCSHNAGCVEAAVMSGRLAAHALSGRPQLDEIIGYDHP